MLPRRDRPAARGSVVGLLGVMVGAALLVLCVVLAWAVVFVVRIGPVIGTIDAGEGHGVHLGDLLAIPLVLTGVAVFVAACVAQRRSARLGPERRR